jgi:hypothetical protein
VRALYPFQAGGHYRQLLPTEYGARWRWKLLTDVAVPLGMATPNLSFCDAGGREWMRLERGWQVLRAGYACNGHSPKLYVPVLGWVGTPDTERNLAAAFSRDGFCQFSGCEGFPLSRAEVDDLYLRIMQARRFCLARVYHAAVRDFGGAYWGRECGGRMTPLGTA